MQVTQSLGKVVGTSGTTDIILGILQVALLQGQHS